MEIQGSFYEHELLTAEQDVFCIDRVIRRDYKKKQALVSWKGYSDDWGLATAFDLAAFRLSMIAPVKKSVNHPRTVASMRETG